MKLGRVGDWKTKKPFKTWLIGSKKWTGTQKVAQQSNFSMSFGLIAKGFIP